MIISFILFLVLFLLVMQHLEVRVLFENGTGRAEIDYSFFTVILKNDSKKRKKHKNRAKTAAAMIRPLGFITKRSSIEIRELTLPLDKENPSSAALKDGYFRTAVIASLSVLSFFSTEILLYDNSLNTTPTGDYYERPTVDIAVKCRLYHIFFSGFLFLVEYIKRNEKNVRKQNE